MKKIVMFLLIPLLVLTSCGKPKTVIPESKDSFILEIESNDDSIVLSVKKTDKGYSACFTEPCCLSGVCILFSDPTVTLKSNDTEIPLSENTGFGVTAIFKAVDRIIQDGAHPNGTSLDIVGYKILTAPDPSPDRIEFTVSDGQNKRLCVLRPSTNEN